MTSVSSIFFRGRWKRYGARAMWRCHIHFRAEPKRVARLRKPRDGFDYCRIWRRHRRDLPQVAGQILLVPSSVTARIEELHIMLGHMLCSAIETNLSFV